MSARGRASLVTIRVMGAALPKWLSVQRRRTSTAVNAADRTLVEEASSDRGRVVFSEAFRRLNQKTQVFALESDGSVRTRLTHSLEVAQVGTYIVDSLFVLLDKQGTAEPVGLLAEWLKLAPHRVAIRTFVEVACLVHDIGNPPFGHFGEKAIRTWFRNHLPNLGAENGDALRRDFLEFDGNKQGLRILTRLQRNLGDDYGLNLTYTQIAATIKYPARAGKSGSKKGSVYESEWEMKEDIWKQLGLSETERHPLALLMEAADDIAYCVSDIEDADARGLIHDQDLADAFGASNERDRRRRFTQGRTLLTNQLVQQAATELMERLKAETFSSSNLLDDTTGGLAKVKAVATRRIYSSPLILANEVTAYRVITGLLDALKPLLAITPHEFAALCQGFCQQETLPPVTKDLTEEPALLALFPVEILATYLASDRTRHELFHRCHLLVDLIAGMTDDAALRMYRLVSGQSTHASHH